MLIELSVTNFKSLQSTQIFSMVASPATELRDKNTFAVPEHGVPCLLRSAAIYGPNASGKSNLIEAIQFLENFVALSSKDGQEGEQIKVTPFLFDSISRNEPSEFEVLFMQEGVRYQYGFTVNKVRVIHEWLIAYPDGRPQRWFERQFNADSSTESWYFSSKFKGRKSMLKEATRVNALFLSTAVQLNNEQLRPAYNWFRHTLRTIGITGLTSAYTTSLCDTQDSRKRIINFLNAADISIADIKVEMKKFDTSILPNDIPDAIRDEIKKSLADAEIAEVKFLHTVHGEEKLVALDIDDESEGTKKLFSFAGPWLDVLDNGYVLFVDELNNSMHPLMVRFLIQLINNPEINRKNAQLIFTTHDTSVLDNEVFRRDQIWFTEKDTANATRLYPLSDFTPRKGEALEKGYLKGRYGAVPYIGEVKF